MTATTEKAPVTTAFNEKGQFILRLFAYLLVLYLLVWIGYKSARIGLAVYHLHENQQTARQLMGGGGENIDPDQLEFLVMNSRHQLLIIEDELAVFMPLTKHLGWVPQVGPILLDAPALMEMATAGMDTAAYGYRGLKPALALLQDPTRPATEILAEGLLILDNAQPDLAAAANAFDQLLFARARLQHVSAYPAAVQTILNEVDPLLPFVADIFTISPVLPALAGSEHERSYLLLAQNEDELRATGGFISGAGLLQVKNGRIQSLDFGDAYGIDDLAGKPYTAYPPAALYDLMQLDYFLFRDANYWPDFPTSAEKALELYEYGQEAPTLDGVIAIDQQFLVLLLQGMGHINLPSGDVATADNLVEQLRASWGEGAGVEADWIQNRKAFLSEFATALRGRLEDGDLAGMEPLLLARGMQTALAGKHLQIYMRDPAVAAVLDELNWDGRMRPNDGGDYLFVLDTNVGFNKSNALVNRQIHYNVQLDALGSGSADLTLNYDHQGEGDNMPCAQLIPYGQVRDYTDITNLCYFNFLRVYTPNDAYLLGASEHTVPADILLRDDEWRQTAYAVPDFAEFSTFANFFHLPPSRSLQSYMGYQLPLVAQGERSEKTYTLVVPKQAGVSGQAIVVTVHLPDGAEYLQAQPTPTAVADNLLRFEFVQVADLSLRVDYRLPRSP